MAGMPYPPNLCTSVQSVGEYLAPEVFCILWRIVMLVHDCFVGAAETAAPPCRVQKMH